jgi:HK97 family phage prohead protease
MTGLDLDATAPTDDDQRPHAPTEYRSAEVQQVRCPERIIELCAVPYDRPAPVREKGRTFVEEIAPGAFNGVERRANRIKANRDHDTKLTIGRCVALHPSRAEGLIAELRIAGTDLGNETLLLAEEGLLDASIGFAPFPGSEVWTENRSRRRITKAWLDHIALVFDPAYEQANVLAVRAMEAAPERVRSISSTPNLDQVKLWQLQDRHGGAGQAAASVVSLAPE